MKRRCVSGLSSGEGLIENVRDARRQNGVVVDPGRKDKRLLVVEEEFAALLQVMTRAGNTLSGVIREAWAAEKLEQVAKNRPLIATRPHISIIGHTTRTDLDSYFHHTFRKNGIANRFLWFLVRDSKDLPTPPPLPDAKLEPLVTRLQKAAKFASTIGEIKRSKKADALWAKIYSPLKRVADDPNPSLGPILARARPQVMRIACLYALLDRSKAVKLKHLEAALAVWFHCEDSIRYIFGDRPGDPLAERLLQLFKIDTRKYLSVTEIHKLLHGHERGQVMHKALRSLERLGFIEPSSLKTAGRSQARWRLVSRPPRS
jgi:Protein of unknown function (DUF3987)